MGPNHSQILDDQDVWQNDYDYDCLQSCLQSHFGFMFLFLWLQHVIVNMLKNGMLTQTRLKFKDWKSHPKTSQTQRSGPLSFGEKVSLPYHGRLPVPNELSPGHKA